MRVVYTLDHRYDSTPDGAVWVRGGASYGYWTQFLEVFDAVLLLARVRQVETPPHEAHRVDGDGVCVAPLPYYIGPFQYLLRSRRVTRAALEAIDFGDAIILCGGQICDPIAETLQRVGHPYAIHVTGDPFDAFSPGAIRHPLRGYMRYHASASLRHLCNKASAASYVTQSALQQRYPCNGLSIGVSDVNIPANFCVDEPRPLCSGGFAIRPAAFKVIMVGSLAQMYKAPDILIKAVGMAKLPLSSGGGGMDIRLTIVGDGKHRPELEAQASRLGLADIIQFKGELPSGQAIINELDKADLFALVSRTEGLPRAMVEAMGRGLPCIGSNVGGIPELLCAEDLVPAGDWRALSRKLCEVACDPHRLALMSERNLMRAREFQEDLLRGRRLAFFSYIRERTEEWLASNNL